ncbi:MAG: DUF4838 domain-containing protein [Thermoguttaceae bacterium]|nr:DUF4838 domain-containing protein [Thermoguttaceae bacterium]
MRATSFKYAVIAALMTLLALPLSAGESPLRLANNAATGYTIVLPEEPTAVQKTAADELASFLSQVTGAQFPIISENQAADKEKLLVIGPSALSKKLLSRAGAEDEASIGQDGIILQTVGDSLVLSGHPDRGPLYAVYTFLEECVGIRWWTSTESTIPSRPRLEVEVSPIRYAPKVISRESFYLDPLSGREGGIFSARMKTNGHFNPVPAEYGGHMPILFWAHSFEQVLPPDKYFNEHPDWYALIDGKRIGDNRHQLCLTNPEMKAEFIHNTLNALRKAPETRFVSVSQNDCGGWCQCPECKKLFEENGSQAGPLITFVNEVAEAIEPEFPNVLVETLAYNDSRFAPSKVKPRDNVVVRLCSIEYSFLTPLIDGGPTNQSFLDCVEKWSAISKNLYIWDYVTNFSNYLLPHTNLQVLAPNIRYFVNNHAVGIFEQGDAGCSAGDFVRLRNWVISKLLWNPDLDQSALEEEFLTGYYSPRVGALLRQYLDILKQSALKSNVLLRCYRSSAGDWLSPEALVEATRLMDQAIAAAEEDEKQDPVRFAGLTKKVRRESIPIRLVWIHERQDYDTALALHHLPSPITVSMRDYFHEFKNLLEENHVSCYHEGGTKEGLNRWLDDHERFVDVPPAEPPREVEGLPNDSWFDAQEFHFRLAGLDKWVHLEEDSNASNKRAARMPGDHTQWAAGWYADHALALNSPSGAEPDDEGRVRGRVLIYARCDVPEDGADKEVMSIGVYDEANRKGIRGRRLKSGELAGSDYKVFDLGTVPLGHEILIWTAPVKDAAPNVYVDRIVIIRQ